MLYHLFISPDLQESHVIVSVTFVQGVGEMITLPFHQIVLKVKNNICKNSVVFNITFPTTQQFMNTIILFGNFLVFWPHLLKVEVKILSCLYTLGTYICPRLPYQSKASLCGHSQFGQHDLGPVPSSSVYKILLAWFGNVISTKIIS